MHLEIRFFCSLIICYFVLPKPIVMFEDIFKDTFAVLFTTGFIIFCLTLAVIILAGQWKVFEKAGQPGWACIGGRGSGLHARGGCTLGGIAGHH